MALHMPDRADDDLLVTAAAQCPSWCLVVASVVPGLLAVVLLAVLR